MNLILCSQQCKHQKEGYCALNEISSLSNNVAAKCGYYEAVDAKNNITDNDVHVAGSINE